MSFKTNIAFTLAAAACIAGNAHAQSNAGALFSMSNGVVANTVTMYTRGVDGSLSLVGTYPTGGKGSGGTNDPLQSQYALSLSPDRSVLVAVNPGTSNISVFRVRPNGLDLVDVTPSFGSAPLSVAVSNSLVYVVNFLGNYHLQGFALEGARLRAIPNTRQVLSNVPDTGASTASFSPDGTKLVVSERLSNKIDVFTVNADGTLANPVINASLGAEPFGLQFTQGGALLVTETKNGEPNASSTSSYTINSDNTLTPITVSASSTGTAACWIATNGAYAYASNTASGTLGGYSVSAGGALAAIGISAAPGAGSFPTDIAFTADGKYLYASYSALGQIIGYSVDSSGKLTQAVSVSPFEPATGAEGLAVY